MMMLIPLHQNEVWHYVDVDDDKDDGDDDGGDTDGHNFCQFTRWPCCAAMAPHNDDRVHRRETFEMNAKRHMLTVGFTCNVK